MNTAHFLIWVTPILVLIAGFFASMIKQFRMGRYGIYLGVLFLAFILDLQSTSFKFDVLDFVFSQLVLLVLADFFWRVVRGKAVVLRVIGLITGCVLFGLTYKEWILKGPGPASMQHVQQSKRLSEYKAHNKIFFIKEDRSNNRKSGPVCTLNLLKSGQLSITEQRIDHFEVPFGYENTVFSFAWTTTTESISVQIIGDTDTLWTLGDPLPQ